MVSAGALTIFTGGGRGGKRQLQRRFLRKRSAAGLPPQAHYVRQIPPFVAARHLPPAGGSQPSMGRLMAMPETLSPPLKPSPWGRWLAAQRQDGRGTHGQAALHFSRKLYRHAKGPILEGAVAEGDWGSSARGIPPQSSRFARQIPPFVAARQLPQGGAARPEALHLSRKLYRHR